ncbi:MAG: SpoIID/LytB domain-containing protein [Oscillospiraceae bacterium]
MKKHIWLFLLILILMIALPAVSLIGPAPSPQAHASEKEKDKAQKPTAETIRLEGFKVLDKSSGKVLKIAEKDYIIGAVASEMPATFHTEALKAQAVAAHTYAVRLRQQQREKPTESLKGADFEADPSNFQGFLTEEAAKARFGENFDSYWKKDREHEIRCMRTSRLSRRITRCQAARPRPPKTSGAARPPISNPWTAKG